MIINHDVLINPKFWASYCCIHFGNSGGSFDENLTHEALQVNKEETLAWWNRLTGGDEGVLDELAGEDEEEAYDPSTLEIKFRRGVSLAVEFHPGDTFYRLVDSDGSRELLGNVGPHWLLPMLRWEEAVSLSAGAELELNVPPESHSSLVLLLLLPGVWLSEGDIMEEGRDYVKRAWSQTALVDSHGAGVLAQLWSEGMNVVNKYRWWQEGAAGWITNAESSLRYVGAPAAQLRKINDLLLRAADA
jgi:hypothetical protein